LGIEKKPEPPVPILDALEALLAVPREPRLIRGHGRGVVLRLLEGGAGAEGKCVSAIRVRRVLTESPLEVCRAPRRGCLFTRWDHFVVAVPAGTVGRLVAPLGVVLAWPPMRDDVEVGELDRSPDRTVRSRPRRERECVGGRKCLLVGQSFLLQER